MEPPVTGSPSPEPSASPAPSATPSSSPSAAGPGPGDPPPGAGFSVSGSGTDGVQGSVSSFGNFLSQFAVLFGRAFDWAVPGLLLSLPGLILVLAIAAQLGGALAWLPLVRRRIGGFGLRSGPAASHP
jgi:hypothetical protein